MNLFGHPRTWRLQSPDWRFIHSSPSLETSLRGTQVPDDVRYRTFIELLLQYLTDVIGRCKFEDRIRRIIAGKRLCIIYVPEFGMGKDMAFVVAYSALFKYWGNNQ